MSLAVNNEPGCLECVASWGQIRDHFLSDSDIVSRHLKLRVFLVAAFLVDKKWHTVKLGYNKLGYNKLPAIKNKFSPFFQSQIHV